MSECYKSRISSPKFPWAIGSRIDMSRVIEIDYGVRPSARELEAIAAALQTEVELIFWKHRRGEPNELASANCLHEIN